jgi:hypothetical protein
VAHEQRSQALVLPLIGHGYGAFARFAVGPEGEPAGADEMLLALPRDERGECGFAPIVEVGELADQRVAWRADGAEEAQALRSRRKVFDEFALERSIFACGWGGSTPRFRPAERRASGARWDGGLVQQASSGVSRQACWKA